MKKPDQKEFNLSNSEVVHAKNLDDKLPQVVFIFSAIIWLVYAVTSGEFSFDPFLLFLGLLLGFAFCLFTTMIALSPATFVLKLFSPVYRKYKEYEHASDTYKAWWVRTQSEFWQSLSGLQFEHELARLYQKLGIQAEVTSASDDKGVDIWLNTSHDRVIVQCKAHKRPIGPGAVRELYGTLQHFGTKQAILASTSGFTKGAIEAAKNKPISFLSLPDILSMQEKCQN